MVSCGTEACCVGGPRTLFLGRTEWKWLFTSELRGAAEQECDCMALSPLSQGKQQMLTDNTENCKRVK